LANDNPASRAYVSTKSKVAKECGFITFDSTLRNFSKEELVKEIEKYNRDPKVDGILLQLPLPQGFAANEFIDRINAEKDVDGLHPYNQGLLMRGEGLLRPCTPLGVMRLIDLALMKEEVSELSRISRANLAGKVVAVIGRSILVGKPVAQLLLEQGATVLQLHSKSPRIEALCSGADIVVAAAGSPGLVKASWVKDGAVVIDVGINRTDKGKLTGDVAYEEVSKKCSAITPVPGGVGPMTVAMLMSNTLLAYKNNAM
jgi:methylenetetrahydrofolate dehydrogenase (NADP+)/methenyltetrahydrofolate cyclohydrolase